MIFSNQNWFITQHQLIPKYTLSEVITALAHHGYPESVHFCHKPHSVYFYVTYLNGYNSKLCVSTIDDWHLDSSYFKLWRWSDGFEKPNWKVEGF